MDSPYESGCDLLCRDVIRAGFQFLLDVAQALLAGRGERGRSLSPSAFIRSAILSCRAGNR